MASILHRAAGHLSRRLDRPELLAALDRGAAQHLREAIALQSVLAALLTSDSVYVDVGTNEGQVLAMAVRAAPEAKHIAFEPIPVHVQVLRAAFPSVDSRALAIADAPGSASFCYFRTMSGWSGLQRQPGVPDDVGHPEFITVRVSTLDLELEGIVPRVVKIDVEGAEMAVLRGGQRVLANARPYLIFEHVAESAALYGTTSRELWDLLTEAGYRVFSITGGAPTSRERFAGSSGMTNWLATPVR